MHCALLLGCCDLHAIGDLQAMSNHGGVIHWRQYPGLPGRYRPIRSIVVFRGIPWYSALDPPWYSAAKASPYDRAALPCVQAVLNSLFTECETLVVVFAVQHSCHMWQGLRSPSCSLSGPTPGVSISFAKPIVLPLTGGCWCRGAGGLRRSQKAEAVLQVQLDSKLLPRNRFSIVQQATHMAQIKKRWHSLLLLQHCWVHSTAHERLHAHMWQHIHVLPYLCAASAL